MAIEFTDIEIGAVDLKESFKRAGPWWETVFDFSRELPPGWAAILDEVWEAEALPRRHVRIQNGQLLTVCPKRPPEIPEGAEPPPPNNDPVTCKEDLEPWHVARLEEAVRKTNAIFCARS